MPGPPNEQQQLRVRAAVRLGGGAWRVRDRVGEAHARRAAAAAIVKHGVVGADEDITQDPACANVCVRV